MKLKSLLLVYKCIYQEFTLNRNIVQMEQDWNQKNQIKARKK